MDEFSDINQPWLEQIFGSFNASRLDMRLFGRSPESFHPDSATVAAMATYVHEHMHYFQTLFTGFGHILWSSHRQSSGYSVRKWKELARTGLGYRFPFAAYSDDPAGGQVAWVVDNTARDVSRISAARFNLPIPNCTFRELKTRLITTDWVINPVVEIAGEKVCLQGKDILEGQAHFVERTLVEALTSSGDIAWDRKGVPAQYTRAFDYFIERCGLTRSAEFPVICDLAQQTSWVPALPATEDDWRKSSPSWRFVQITDLIAADCNLSFGGPADWPSRFIYLASDIFKRLGYLSPEKVIEERLSAFTRVPELLDVEQVMKAAMEFRSERPWMAANPAADLTWLEELLEKFRAPSVVIDGAFVKFGEAPVNGSQIVFELHFQALANQLIGPIKIDDDGNGVLQCGFGQFKVDRGCPYQISHNCSTHFRPSGEPPVPTARLDNDEVDGCSFAFGLQSITGDLKKIQLVPGARFPAI
ncbi:MAG: hypothetical protein J0M28_11975 [Thauera sp.]|nr:hypothetical protein [Thauera sp.]